MTLPSFTRVAGTQGPTRSQGSRTVQVFGWAKICQTARASTYSRLQTVTFVGWPTHACPRCNPRQGDGPESCNEEEARERSLALALRIDVLRHEQLRHALLAVQHALLQAIAHQDLHMRPDRLPATERQLDCHDSPWLGSLAINILAPEMPSC